MYLLIRTIIRARVGWVVTYCVCVQEGVKNNVPSFAEMKKEREGKLMIFDNECEVLICVNSRFWYFSLKLIIYIRIMLLSLKYISYPFWNPKRNIIFFLTSSLSNILHSSYLKCILRHSTPNIVHLKKWGISIVTKAIYKCI